MFQAWATQLIHFPRSLRGRLLLVMILVLAVTGGLAAWFAGIAITARFEQYLIVRQEESQIRRQNMANLLPQILADHYARTGEWPQASDLIHKFGELTEEHILLTDATGKVIADSRDAQIGEVLDNTAEGARRIVVDGQMVGAVQIPPTPLTSHSASEDAFVAQINRSLLLALLAASVVALLLTLWLSRGILRRVGALTAAVQQMERGDLTQRVQNGASDEIGQLAHAFNAMADGLARIEQLRRNMVSDVAHELRTPLSNIRGYLEAIQDGLVEPTPAVIQSLYEEAILLHRLINDLQELAIAEAGQLQLACQPIAINELVDKAIQGVSGRVNGERNLHRQLGANLPAVFVDAERIGQVMRNLLNNAVEYTPPGGTITVGTRLLESAVQVNVHNEGIGIAPEHLSNVFERFYRVDDSRTRATGGSGLGLAIVKYLVEAHGGRVWVESEAGRFANFYFSIPLAPRA